jgi:hypothetical protein
MHVARPAATASIPPRLPTALHALHCTLPSQLSRHTACLTVPARSLLGTRQHRRHPPAPHRIASHHSTAVVTVAVAVAVAVAERS